jgi:hypothetical protein
MFETFIGSKNVMVNSKCLKRTKSVLVKCILILFATPFRPPISTNSREGGFDTYDDNHQTASFGKSHVSSQVPKHLVTSAPSFLISSNHVTKMIQTTISYGIGQWKHDILCS